MATQMDVKTGTALLDLAERVEQAQASEEYGLIREAFDAVWPEKLRGVNADREYLIRLLDAGGFIDAAVLLAPEGRRISDLHESEIADLPPFVCRLSERNADFGRAKVVETRAATAALALTAAALRARSV